MVRVLTLALPVMAVVFVVLHVLAGLAIWVVIGVLVVGPLGCLFFMVGMARDFSLARLARHGFRPDVLPPPTRWIPEDATA